MIKKMKKNKIAVLLTFILLCTLAVSCADGSGSENPVSPDTQTPSVTVTQTPETETPSPEPEPTAAVSEYSADTLMMSVAGSPVYWDEFRYWLYTSLKYIAPQIGIDPDGPFDSTALVGDVPLYDFIKNDAVRSVTLYRMIELNSTDMNVTLTSEDESEIADIRAENMEMLGGEEAYLEYLKENRLSEEQLDYILRVSSLYYKLFNEIYGEDGGKCPDADAIAFGNEYGIMRAKHILIKNFDDENNRLSDEQIAQNYEILEGLIAQLDASSDPVALFDELIDEYSEDGGKVAYPDGYQFSSGEMVSEFENAVLELGDYEYSPIVNMEVYGYTVIMRLPLDPDGLDMSGNSLRFTAASMNYQTLTETWAGEAVVEYTDAYNALGNLEGISF